MKVSTYSLPKEVERKILTAINLKKQLEEYDREIREEVLKAMQDNDVLSIKNDTYTITRAVRRTYSADLDTVSKKYTKRVLDTQKCATHAKLYGELPKGISESQTEYITWRAK